ncbi:hypothetical protein [Kordiimonas pumila]|uniref:Uncharacterized protein n=1 Tax=Kordiimonas pumila TaxID=2161677 RepID=A0ABV7D7G7_9PROT|nr:hypothetical protein [Kordiimonas pumila]
MAQISAKRGRGSTNGGTHFATSTGQIQPQNDASHAPMWLVATPKAHPQQQQIRIKNRYTHPAR